MPNVQMQQLLHRYSFHLLQRPWHQLSRLFFITTEFDFYLLPLDHQTRTPLGYSSALRHQHSRCDLCHSSNTHHGIGTMALTMYSTESAIKSRDGNEYSIPSCPIAIPSSTAMVLNSFATPPEASISRNQLP